LSARHACFATICCRISFFQQLDEERNGDMEFSLAQYRDHNDDKYVMENENNLGIKREET
jgi:hypothetical protein